MTFPPSSACDDSQPEGLSKSQALGNLSALADKMGMSQKCKTAASQYATDNTSHSIGSGGGSGSVGLFGGLFHAGGSGQHNSMTTSTSAAAGLNKSASGCGDFVLNSNRIFNESTQVHCHLNSVSVKSDNIQEGTANLTIEVIDSVSIALQGITEKLEDPSTTTAESAELLRAEEILSKEAKPSGNLNIENSSLTAKVTGDLKVIKKIDVETKENIKKHMINIAKATSSTKLSEALHNSLPNESNHIVENHLQKDIKAMVDVQADSVMENSVSKSEGSSTILLKVVDKKNVNFDNVVFDADTNLKLITENILTKSIDIGKNIVATKVNEARDDLSSHTKSSDPSVAAIMAAIGKSNANLQKLVNKGFKSQVQATGKSIEENNRNVQFNWFTIVFAILVVVAGVVMFEALKSGAVNKAIEARAMK